MNETQIRKWATTRKLGKSRYVIRQGVIGWGVPVAILFSTLMAAIKGWDYLWVVAPLSAIVFPIVGIAFGILKWQVAEKAFIQVNGLVE